MAWLPEDFFIGHPGAATASVERPLGQGDVFTEVPVATRTGVTKGQVGAKVKLETVIVIASSCGMRKEGGELNPAVHVAPIKRLQSVAPGWSEPWEGWLHLLPLPGLYTAGEVDVAANLAGSGPCGSDNLALEKRIASVSLAGMSALKARIATYFVRAPIPDGIVRVAAHEEWHELDLWERWTSARGTSEGFQQWLDVENPNYSGRRRRDTLYDDLVGVQQQLDDELAS